jgi:hypothetical protein
VHVIRLRDDIRGGTLYSKFADTGLSAFPKPSSEVHMHSLLLFENDNLYRLALDLAFISSKHNGVMYTFTLKFHDPYLHKLAPTTRRNDTTNG